MTSDERRDVLAGRRVVVTRARAQASDLGDRLAKLGAEVLYCPAIRLAPPADAQPFQRAVQELDRFDWVVLTSVNGVAALLGELERQGRGALDLATKRVACVGPATAEALRARGVTPQAMPAEFVSAGIATVLDEWIRAGQRRVLLVRGAGGTPELPARLRDTGADLSEVEAYRSLPDRESLAGVRALLAERAVDLITFTSPSTVTYFVEAVGEIPERVLLAAIGPVTADRMRELGLAPDIVAPDHTIPGLVRAVSSFFAEQGLRRGQP